MRIEEISSKKNWENFIKNYSPESIFQSWNWGEVIIRINKKKGIENRLWRFGLYEKNNLVGIAQVEKVVAKRGTFLHIRHGPIFIKWKANQTLFLIDYLKKLAKLEKASFIRLSPLLVKTNKITDFFRNIGCRDAPIHSLDGELCWILDLDKSEPLLLSEMRKTTRYMIRKAEKLGVRIIKSKDKKDIKDFLELYHITAKRHHFIEHVGIAEEFDVFLKDDQILLFKGYYKQNLISAALMLYYNHQSIYHHSASLEQKIPVSYLLQWEAIKEAKSRKKKLHNFWGIAPQEKPRHPWAGLTLFKKGFGGRTLEYIHAQDLPISYRYVKTYLIETFRKYWKGY